MSELPRSSRDRTSSSRSRKDLPTSGSSRRESSSLRHSSELKTNSSPRPTTSKVAPSTPRRSHSTGPAGLPPRDEKETDDEVAARLERREERRRQREKEGGKGKTSSRRSSSVPRRPSSAGSGNAQHDGHHASPHVSTSRVGASKSPDNVDLMAIADEATGMLTSLSARKAAYLQAVEKPETRRPVGGSDGSAGGRRSSADNLAIRRSRSSEEEIHSPDRSSRSSKKSGSDKSRRVQKSPKEAKSPSKKERKSRHSFTTDDEKRERLGSRDGDLSRKSGSSGDKSRKKEKRSSLSDDGMSPRRDKSKKREKNIKDDRSELLSHRSSRNHCSGDSDLLVEDDRSERRSHRLSRDDVAGDHKHRSRSPESRKIFRVEDFRRRRDERLAKSDDVDDEYRKMREERLARREERRLRSHSKDEPRRSRSKETKTRSRSKETKSRVRSSSVPRYLEMGSQGDEGKTEPRHRSEGIVGASTTSAVSRSRLPPTDGPKDASTSITRNAFEADSSETGSRDRKSASSEVEAARERLRERQAARERVREALAASSKRVATGTQSQQKVGGDASLVERPNLAGVKRLSASQRYMEMDNDKFLLSEPSSSESETEEESLPSHMKKPDDFESSEGDEDEALWTIRVSVISAVDLPLNIVPNMPLCPVLKFGLIHLPPGAGENGKTYLDNNASEKASSSLSILEKSGLTSIPRARVRCTTNKILSKRDNGTVEFHEEMRWDRVKRPMRTALVVELSAKAALPPANARESPILNQRPSSNQVPLNARGATPVAVPTFRSRSGEAASATNGFVPGADFERTESGDNPGGPGPAEIESSMAASIKPPLSPKPGAGDEDAATPAVPGAGLTGMRALWKRGRQQFEQRQETKLNSPTDGEPGQLSTAVSALLGGVKGREATGRVDGGLAGPPCQGLMRDQAAERVATPLEDENVALLMPKKKKRKLNMAKDLRLGSLVIPLTRLPLEKAIQKKEAARIEQWYQLDTSDFDVPAQTPAWRGKISTKPPPRRSPNVQLEISFSPPEVLDESEDEMDDVGVSDLTALGGDTVDEHKETAATTEKPGRPSLGAKSFSRRISSEMRLQEQSSEMEKDSSTKTQTKQKVSEDPMLKPGLVDFICVVGVNNIGDQKDDDGSKGWVNTNPECTLLEQFPPDDEFHFKNGRNVTLANKVEWFCFPEGWRLWRGTEPPSHADINMNRHASSATVASHSLAAFDACLGCATSFSWFVIASNSDEYGSRNVKTYGAVIKFYAPAPKGIDQTQEDYAQTQGPSTGKRLWVPMGICLTSNLPIIGVLEAMLLRICETLAVQTGGHSNPRDSETVRTIIQKDISNLIVNFPVPIPGVLHCSIPFLSGERLHVTLPPPTGLPALPHGNSITSVCRLLGPEGLNLMLAALLTECKILLHSEEVANIPMAAEVMTALIYPFNWALPYIPVLPDAMLEFVEAPLSYLLGIPTSSLKMIDPTVLDDIVVIDLDGGFGSSDYFEGRRANKSAAKAPTPLPSAVATKISKAVFRLLREEGQVEEEYGATNFPGSRTLPRLESESLAERDFRIAVALQVSGLVRGYDDCLFKVSASQPVFNRDKFLRTAPALFENQRGNLSLAGTGRGAAPRTLSPRSKRFLSILVNCQHFHQFLQTSEEDECAFFNEVMYTFDMSDEQDHDRMLGGYGASTMDEAAAHLSKALQKVEDKVPTYRVERMGKKKRRPSGGWDDEEEDIGLQRMNSSPLKGSDRHISVDSFPYNLLQPLCMDTKAVGSGGGSSEGGVHSISVQYLLELEKGTWKYEKLFDIPMGSNEEGKHGEKASLVHVREKVKLREAIGERRYRAWKLAQEQKLAGDDGDTRLAQDDIFSAEGNPALDLTSLLSSMADDSTAETSSLTQSTLSSQSSARHSTLSPEQQRVADAKDRDVVRRCLERAYEGSRRRSTVGRRPSDDGVVGQGEKGSFFENGRDLIAEAETALQNPSAQRFLVSVLSQRSRLENHRKRRSSIIEDPQAARKQSQTTSVSRLESSSFECVVRLCWAMLDSCVKSKDYEPAYGLLTHTAGFCTVKRTPGVAIHPDDRYDNGNKVIYMTARIGTHPIFADLSLWEEVLRLHLKDRENDKTPAASGAATFGKAKESDLVEYEAAVATLYEMLGFGIPAEELARFATRVSEEHGWFETERGHSLLMLARRLMVKSEGAGTAGDLDLMSSSRNLKAVDGGEQGSSVVNGGAEHSGELEWCEIGWCHPAAPSSIRAQYLYSGSNGEGDDLMASRRLKRSAVTSIASFGSSIVASGGLDGSVFIAHTIKFGQGEDGQQSENVVKGVHLDWGSSGSRTAAVASSLSSMDGEYGVGAVSCLAAAKGAGYRSAPLSAIGSAKKDVKSKADEDDFLSAMEGCRVVAGTTAGDLRVWSVRDVYAATVIARKGSEGGSSSDSTRTSHAGSGSTSSFIGKAQRRGSITDIAAGSAFSRLKFSLRGRALSGHRGGVSCMDVPSHVYRPDALVTGGADGFIKLWSLRQPMAGRRAETSLPGARPTMFNTTADPMQGRATRSGDALSILSGHTGRVLCVKSAWHGDRLLSGGADRTVRIWDLAGSGGKCLQSLTGHLGWVTHAQYWGPNTIVTASTDRSIALWDPRVRRSPLFILRYHYSPVSDLLVGSRTDPLMVSAAADGTIATWDFRTLSGSNRSTEPTEENSSSPAKATEGGKHAKAVRTPIATMKHCAEGRGVRESGSLILSRGVTHTNAVLSVGVDAIVREWDISSGRLLNQEATGQCDGVSSLATFSDAQNAMGTSAAESGSEGHSKVGGIITSSWDGTVRMRKFIRK